ncbi:uncharacterized protein LOC132830083 [Hemiscyllium ocellatum]|uniref:uncharacterized protein LOC132830083 n=1 Tax=Hemiscyllium ocellatum TaxID=170820 RepID=UPI0029660FF6|nr:uncharacterized protein LOC132830083 [Hemiscyllium ocellatum]
MIPVKQLRVAIGLFLLLVLIQLQENTTSTCSVKVGYPRAKFNCSVGDSLTLNCTVLFCPQDRLVTYWCKVLMNTCQRLNSSKNQQLDSHSSENTERLLLVVFTVPSVTLADSGIYSCHAQQNGVESQGHSIIVNVFENTKAACSLSILHQRAVFNYSVGDSLTLNCTVQFCVNEVQLPEAHWCKMHGNLCQPVTGRTHYPNISYSLQDKEMKMSVIHTVTHVELSTSGFYQCQATQGAVTTVGQLVHVNVTESSPTHSVWRWYNIGRWVAFGLMAMMPLSLCILGSG